MCRATRKLTLLYLLIFLPGCSHLYYVAPVQNVPLLSEKDEIKIAAFAGFSEAARSQNLQVSWAVTDNIGIMANLFRAQGFENHDNSWGKGYSADFGAGYYRSSGEHRIFEIYGGAGPGKQNHSYRPSIFDEFNPDMSAGNSSLSSFKLFLQPSIGWKFKGFELAFSSRFNRLSFFKIKNRIDGSLNGYDFDKLNDLAIRKTYLFFEPAITLRFGWEEFKIQIQGTVPSYLNDNRSPFDQYHLSAGAFCSF